MIPHELLAVATTLHQAAQTATPPPPTSTTTGSGGSGLLSLLNPVTWVQAAAAAFFGYLWQHIAVWLASVVLSSLADVGQITALWRYDFAQSAIHLSQAAAAGLLAMRLAWEAYQNATLRAEGVTTDPGSLLKRTVAAAVAIAVGPLLAEQAFLAANSLAAAIAGLIGVAAQPGALQSSLTGMATGLVGGATADIGMILVAAVFALLLPIVLISALVRSLEALVLIVLAPVLALGFMSGGGTADAWLRELLVICGAQAIQVLMVFLAVSFVVNPSQLELNAATFGIWGLLWGIAALWVALRAPSVIRQYSYHSGAGGVMNQGLGMVLSAAAKAIVM